MANIAFQEFFGSFQEGIYVWSERPLEEAWFYWSRFASPTTIRRHYSPDRATGKWDEAVEYAAVRFRQATELRHSASTTSVLTSPLTLYYAMLNLTRGAIAIRREIIPTKKHGLIKFERGTSLLDSAVTTDNAGTCNELSDEFGVHLLPGSKITLLDCISNIPELAWDLHLFDPHTKRVSGIVPTVVVARSDGRLRLEFLIESSAIHSNWSVWFPDLAGEFDLLPSKAEAVIRDQTSCQSAQAVAALCNRLLWPSLRWNDDSLMTRPRWWAHRRDANSLHLPRAVYPFIATFILSSVVRYEPEMLIEAERPSSEFNWLLRRTLLACERYFPQLMTALTNKTPFFF